MWVENLGATGANWCSCKLVRIFAATLSPTHHENSRELLNGDHHREQRRSTRLGLTILRLLFVLLRIFFGSSDHESFEIVPQFKKKVGKKNKKKKRKKNRRRTNVEEKEGD